MSMERERKDGKLWQELRAGIKLRWIVVNKKLKQASNLSSLIPLGGQRHWPTEKDFLIRLGSVLPSKDILSWQVVECILLMKFRVIYSNGTGEVQTTLKLTELSMQLGDVEGAQVNGRNSLLILKESLTCPGSKNYSEVLESYQLYSEAQSAAGEGEDGRMKSAIGIGKMQKEPGIPPRSVGVGFVSPNSEKTMGDVEAGRKPVWDATTTGPSEIEGDSEYISMILVAFLDERGVTFHLEDKVNLLGGSNVMHSHKAATRHVYTRRGKKGKQVQAENIGG